MLLRLRRYEYERISAQNLRFRSNGGRLTQNVRSSPPTILFLVKTRINDLSYGINLDRFFFRFVTIRAFDGHDTDRGERQTDKTDTFLATRPPYIECSAVKTYGFTNLFNSPAVYCSNLLGNLLTSHSLRGRSSTTASINVYILNTRIFNTEIQCR